MGYIRDQLGRVIEKTETVDGTTKTYEYKYDLSGRLEEVWIDSMLVSKYEYDPNGNRLKKIDYSSGSAVETTGEYDDQDRMLSYGDATFTYTENGEMLTKTDAEGTTAYDYDVFGNLRKVTLSDGNVVDYVIDGQNRRVGKKVNGVLMQGFVYNDQLKPIAELDGSGNVVSVFVYGSKYNIPDYMVKAGVTYRVVSDHLGSPRIILDSSTGAVVQELDYDEYGNVIQDTNPGFQPFGFAGMRDRLSRIA